jgi:DNA-binding GntR family transcriptional regulator
LSSKIFISFFFRLFLVDNRSKIRLYFLSTKINTIMKSTFSLRENIYQNIRDEITCGNLSPGERLLEDKLAEKFKVSRSPIREALRQLESEGLIQFERSSGIRVTKLSIKQVDEIYSLRWLLESYAARLTAESSTKKDIMYLRKLNEKLRKAAKMYDLKSWLENNTLFHNFFADYSGNSNLIQILDILKRRIYRYRMVVRVPGHFEDYIRHHEGIVKGCEKRDGEMAERYMKIHLEMVKRVTIDFLNSFSHF